MKKKLLLVLLCLSIYNISPAQNSVIEGEILIQTRSSFSEEAMINDFLYDFKYQNEVEFNLLSSPFQVILLHFDKNKTPQSDLITELQKHPNVVNIQENHLTTYRNDEKTPHDSLYSKQWSMDIIKSPSAWFKTTGGLTALGDTIVVGLIDEGTDFSHEDLQGNLWFNTAEIPNDGIDNDNNGFIDDYRGWSFSDNNDNHPPTDHGTASAGIIGAKGNNNIGITGVNWNVKIMVLSQAISTAEIVQAYDYMYHQRQKYNTTNGAEGAYVIVSSIAQGFSGQAENNPIWCNIYDKLGEIGIINVAATINSPINVDIEGDIPTSCESDFLITVTNTGDDDELRSTAGFGEKTIDLGAPGSGAFSLTYGNGYDGFAGTSAAVQHVSGGIALLHSLPNELFAQYALREPKAAATLMKSVILGGVDVLPTLEEKTVSEGRLNLFNSLEQLNGYFQGFTENLGITNLYPNPVQETLILHFETPDEPFQLFIYNEIGQLITNWTVMTIADSPTILSINVSAFQSGVYFLQLKNNKKVAIEKFVKN
jgi:hypothetical protein